MINRLPLIACAVGVFAVTACNEDSPTTPPVEPDAAVAATGTYRVRNLGTLGGNGSSATDINDLGHVVGSSEIAGGPYGHAFLWRNGVMTDLGTLGGNESRAEAINNAGQIVGSSGTANRTTRAFLWSGGRMRNIGSLGGSHSVATGINNQGQVVGWSYLPGDPKADPDDFTPISHAFLWQNGVIKDLGTLGGQFSQASDINDNGEIVGVSSTKELQNYGFRWKNGVMTRLPPLDPEGSTLSAPAAINRYGVIVGQAGVGTFPQSESHAFRYANGAMADLGTCGGVGYCAAHDIGEGRIVGAVDNPFSIRRGFVMVGGGVILLPRLSGKRNEANAINRDGHIVGWAETSAGTRATLWRLE